MQIALYKQIKIWLCGHWDEWGMWHPWQVSEKRQTEVSDAAKAKMKHTSKKTSSKSYS